MALTPGEMHAAILANLEAKSGHPLPYWLDRLREADDSDAKARRDHLKSLGLGHFQAQAVARAASGEADPYADPEALVNALFPATLRPGYDAFAKTCLGLGDDVAARPCQTYVPFYARTQFAIIKPGTDGTLEVGLALPADFTHAELAPATGLGGSERITHRTSLPPDGSLTTGQRTVLAEAYTRNR